MGKTVLETFSIFPFSIVLALALGEAFKQCVTDGAGTIKWNRIPALLTFLLLILPFYQGMNRYLLLIYGNAPAATHQYSAIALAFDGAAFMIESAVFFAMSRNLNFDRWYYFYWIVLFLLVVDSCWGFSALLHPSSTTDPVIQDWMRLNFSFAVVLLILLLAGSAAKWKWPGWAMSIDWIMAIAGTLAMLVRTIIDYWRSWTFYFP